MAEQEIRLVKVQPAQIEALKQYVVALYEHDEDYDSMVNIEEGVSSLMRNEALASAYFIQQQEARIGYTILTKYHSVEKGGLTIYIDELYVEQDHRRHGVGAKIMEKIVRISKDQGVKTLWAQTEGFNQAAQKFFLSQGFAKNPSLNFERQL